MNTETKVKLTGLKRCFFDQDTTTKFIDFLMNKAEVIAPHAKGENSFSYEIVSNSADVVFDYPRTIQPLKKFFLPPRETLLSFNLKANDFKEEKIEAKERVFFGIHSYEMVGVQRLDYAFERGNGESNYMSRRENSLFIGMSYNPDDYHFSQAVGIEITDVNGFSLFFDKTENGYMVFEVDQKGADLLAEFGVAKAEEGTYAIEDRPFNNKVKLHYNRLPQVFDHVYKSKVWDEVAKRCVGCGTCNLLCSTCYCFDVRDEIELDAEHGTRERSWDGCMLNSFAEVAGGENFREKLSNRTRHRLHRKFKYITETSGEIHCVGCGRCSKYCPADISIVGIINDLIDDYSNQQKKQVNWL